MRTNNPTVYAVYGLPPAYSLANPWDNLDVSPEEQLRITEAFKSPINSTIFIQGSAAPIVQQLINQNMKVRGIDFSKRQMNAFEEHNNPEADVIVIWNVNKYSGKAEVSINMLDNLVSFYRSKNAMVIVQSSESFVFMRDNYGFSTLNKLKFLPKPDVKWLS